jgi:hypothetical protein
MNEWHVISWVSAILAAAFALYYVILDTQPPEGGDDGETS